MIISNPTISKAQQAANKFNVPHVTDNAMEVINHPDVDAVWICSPSQFHAEQIKVGSTPGCISGVSPALPAPRRG